MLGSACAEALREATEANRKERSACVDELSDHPMKMIYAYWARLLSVFPQPATVEATIDYVSLHPDHRSVYLPHRVTLKGTRQAARQVRAKRAQHITQQLPQGFGLLRAVESHHRQIGFRHLLARKLIRPELPSRADRELIL
jgi:hypothetical protein